ncbi:uncharacterized protein LOC116432243 [Nomia melanderi]|uniref:uncharacterized protein LOC116432243 n=1 Tax=Nomia melanderi TaxID=2448451 RepID=UPI0013042D25|nr:zinc finger protein MSN4-like [Nomia melanderi]
MHFKTVLFVLKVVRDLRATFHSDKMAELAKTKWQITSKLFNSLNGLLPKNAWSTINNCNAPMDDALLKDASFNDPFYYPGAENDPYKKQLFGCTLCGRTYTWMYSLRRHLLQCGNKEARNKCQFCSRKFYRRDRLKEHLLAHHSDMI